MWKMLSQNTSTVRLRQRQNRRRYQQRHPEKRKEEKRRYYLRNRMEPKNTRRSGTHWTIREIMAIMATNHPLDRVLSRRFGRTIEAIQMKRYKLKKLQAVQRKRRS